MTIQTLTWCENNAIWLKAHAVKHEPIALQLLEQTLELGLQLPFTRLGFFSRNFGAQSGPTLYIFVVPGGPGPYRGPGPEASASPASWMIRP